MPGFDQTGPMGMGAITGGGRGVCNPYYRSSRSGSFRPGPGATGGGRGYRHVYRATGIPGWMRSSPPGSQSIPMDASLTDRQGIDSLKKQAKFLGAKLEAIHARLQEFESTDRNRNIEEENSTIAP